MATESLSLRPTYALGTVTTEASETQRTIDNLDLNLHVEGGYFVQTDRDKLQIQNPFLDRADGGNKTKKRPENDDIRAASSSIFYLLTPKSPQGFFHSNHCRIIHTLHRGRGKYVIIHADEVEMDPDNPAAGKRKARIETFVVGNNIDKGEKLQWIVEGGKYKASFLLPDGDENNTSNGLLISETAVPGFEYQDNEIMTKERLNEVVDASQAEELAFLIREGPAPEGHELI
ncbi:MAG: hypothetical protein M1839_006320 [Geoglossum umbratile]|nr:MAG: hypothetical protein M1839_006320 [Geoglossum umbratile]